MLEGFLSEMSAEPIHGGGITIHRVLEDDILSIKWYAKILQYSSEPWPSYDASVKSYVFPWWQLDSMLSPLLGRSRAHRVAYSRLMRYLFAKKIGLRLARIQSLSNSNVLVCPQSELALHVCNMIHEKYSINYITWIMDDHLVRWIDGQWRYPAGIELLFTKHLQCAKAVVVISEEMRDFYRNRFNVDSTVIHAPAPATSTNSNLPPDLCEPIRLVYFGGLGPWQNDALELVIPSLLQGECLLDIYTRQEHLLPKSLNLPSVCLRSPVSPDQVHDIAKDYHAAILPVSFNSETRQMSYFNIATKFAECMSGPIPTLLIGPADAAMCKVASMHKCAFMVTSVDPRAMSNELSRLRIQTARISILERAHQLAENELSSDVFRNKWNAVMLSL